MSFGFLSHVLQGNQNPGGGVLGFLGSIAHGSPQQQANIKQSIPKFQQAQAQGGPNLIQQIPAGGAQLAESIYNAAAPHVGLPQQTFHPTGPIATNVFGNQPVQSLQQVHQGLEQHHGGAFSFLATAAIGGGDVLGLTPAGFGKEGLVKDLVKTATTEDATKILVKNGIDEGVAREIAPAIAQTKDPGIIQDIINKAHPIPTDIHQLSKVAVNSIENTGEVKPGGIERAAGEIDNGSALPIRAIRSSDGQIFIEDGTHRLEAARQAGINDFPVRDVTTFAGARSAAQEAVNLKGAALQSHLAKADTSSAAGQVMSTLAEAQKTRNLQETGYSAERSARLGQSQAAGSELPGLAGHQAELGALKGELGKEQYEGLSGHLPPDKQDELFTQLREDIKANPDIQGYAKLNTAEAARKVIYGDSGVPTNSEITLLKNAFGDQFASHVKEDVVAHNERMSAFKTFGQKAGDILGVPRTIMASADFSGGLRQGLALATRHPIQFAQEFGKQFKYAFSEKDYEGAQQLIHEHPDYPLLQQAKVAVQEVGDHPVSDKEEQFVSNLAEQIPGIGKIVHGSNRAYTGLLNNLRARNFYNLVASARKAGVDFNDPANYKLLKDLGTVVNTSTGRGNLGRFEAAGNALSTALFAPRLIASRLSMLDPRYYINLEPAARKEALTTLASLSAFGTGILGLAALAGAKVSTDPTNADFAKIKVGDTRLDPLGGYSQYIRLGAQLGLGKKTSSTTGATTELGKGFASTRWDVFANFLQNKAAPVPSFAITALKGKDAAGNPINYPKEIMSRFTPLLAQDINDLRTHDNAVGGSNVGKAGAAAAGLFGVGLQTYSAQDNPLTQKQTKYVDTLKQSGADKQTVTASTRFFQNLKEASGTRTNVNQAVDRAIAAKNLPKAQQLANQYNKELAAGMQKWAQQYGEKYGNNDLQSAYNHQKINLTSQSIQSRIKSLASTKPY